MVTCTLGHVIDLRRTRHDLMASIDAAPAAPWLPLEDTLDARWLTADAVRLQLTAHSRRELFPILNLVLRARLHDLARDILFRDVLVPVKNALGNADKRGNARDRSKSIRVEVYATPQGVLVAITDEGPGFDVVRALEASRANRRDAERGAGFRALDRSTATVSFEQGGRAVLLCLRHAWTAAPSETSWRAPHALEAALSQAHETTHGAITNCRFFLDAREPRWPLRVAARFANRTLPSVFAARRLTTEAATRSERTTLESLRHAAFEKLHIPQPLARCAEDPCLVVYGFDPWMNLWEYLDDRGDARSARRAGMRIGHALRLLQGLPLHLPQISWTTTREAALRRGEAWVSTVGHESPERCERLRAAWTRAAASIRAVPEPRALPSHGALLGTNIHYGVDGRFYLSFWEDAGARQPGHDVATFLTDMLAYALTRSDHALFTASVQGIAETYAMQPEVSSWWPELPALMACQVTHADLGHASVDRVALLEQALTLDLGVRGDRSNRK